MAKKSSKWLAFPKAATPKKRQKAFKVFFKDCSLDQLLNGWTSDLMKSMRLSREEWYSLTKMALLAAMTKATNLKEAKAIYWSTDLSPLGLVEESLAPYEAEANSLDIESFQMVLAFASSDDDIDEILQELLAHGASHVFYRGYITRAFARVDEINS